MISIDEHIHLRCFQPGDAAPLFELADRNRARLRQWLPWVDATRSADDTRAFIAKAAEEFATRKALHLGIWVDGELAGGMGCPRMRPEDRCAEIGYWIAAPYEGRGIVTRCCRAVIPWVFREFQVHRIEIHCAVENVRSAAVPARLGFTHEAVLREAIRLNGVFHDREIWGLLDREWTS